MAKTYKTPGVYVEEIANHFSSVVQVETALPAFVGYTETAKRHSAGDLINVPLRIRSAVEYEFYFGTSPSPSFTEVNIDINNNFVSAVINNNFYVYDSIKMFYSNGGGDCIIVSIGNYSSSKSKDHFIAGINKLGKEDEPTILLFPDAVTLHDADIAVIQQAALDQCNLLQDRVCIFDMKQNDPMVQLSVTI